MNVLVTLRPLEAVLFRDGRPFDANGQAAARALDPQPATIFGAVRTAALTEICDDLDTYGHGGRCQTCTGSESCPAVALAGPPGAAGNTDHAGSVTLRGCCLYDASAVEGERVLFPAPALLTAITTAGQRGVEMRGPRPFDGTWDLAAGSGGSTVVEAPLPVAVDANAYLPAWLTVSQFEAVLAGHLPEDLGLVAWRRVVPPGPPGEHLVVSDSRVGLALEDGRARQGLLYRADFRRYRPDVAIGAIAEVGDEDDSPRFAPFVPFGGKGREAQVEALPLSEWPQPPVVRRGRYAVCIVTPGYFGGGWHPTPPPGTRLASSVVGPALAAKGWDLARRRSRPVRWLCPAGSVWWFDAETDDGAAEIAAWHGRSLCSDRPNAGYGLAFVSNWEVPDGPA